MRADLTDLKNRATGRWVEILIAAGMPPKCLQNSRGGPCPKCGGRDRFSALGDVNERGAVHCRKCFTSTTAYRPGDGLATLKWFRNAPFRDVILWLQQYLFIHPLARAGHVLVQPIATRPVEEVEWLRLARAFFEVMPKKWRARAAELLGLPADPLRRLRCGWSKVHKATTWPMRDSTGAIVGILVRCPKSGRKWVVRGSTAGLFFSADLPNRIPLWIVEGPTDCAALMSIGLAAVGVPSAGSRTRWAADLARRTQAPEVIVVADRDEAGSKNAHALVSAFSLVCPVRVIRPPAEYKDARAWVIGGATADTLHEELSKTPR